MGREFVSCYYVPRPRHHSLSMNCPARTARNARRPGGEAACPSRTCFMKKSLFLASDIAVFVEILRGAGSTMPDLPTNTGAGA
jgi:hypothetical protein